MRLRPLIVCSIVLALLPAATPAYADDQVPTPAPAAQATAPPPPTALPTDPATDPATEPTGPPTTEPPTAEPPASDAPPSEPSEAAPSDSAPPAPEDKVEEGLGVDGGTVRAIVELADPAQDAPVAAQAARESVDVVLQPRTQEQPFMVVEGTAEELAALAEDPRVTSIHRDRTFTPTAVGGNLKLIGADQAHAKGFTGAGQAVAVLDTGIDRDHPYFGNRIVAEACFSNAEQGVRSLCPNGQPQQTGAGAADAATAACLADGVNLCEHGTHVAGIAAGGGGVAPGAGIVAVQVFSRVDDEDVCGEPSCLLAFESSLRQAMDWVATLTQPVAAVNLSLGGELSETACDTGEDGAVFKQKIDALLAKGVATVVAAGNEYFEGASYPACVSTAVAVGASDDADAMADFSNRGALVDLFAPGVDVESSVPDNQMAVHSGTSMAAPHVAGALALMKAASPDTPMAELVEKLKASGRPYVYQANGAQVTTPRLDLAAALAGAATQPPVTQTPVVPEPWPTDDASPDDPSDGGAPAPGPTDDGRDTGDPDPAPTSTATSSPVPLPTVTVTVTVTPTPSPSSSAGVCTRGTAGGRMSARQWAVEVHRSSGTIADATLVCYLKLIQKASKVFPETTKASSLGKAYRVLKSSGTAKAKLDAALLTGWLNWAHGGANATTALKAAEKVRLSGKASSAALRRAAKTLTR
ncbi:S8 family peptidase [Nonomuraea pusilla]|uniref:Serine protease, subtilisin family n=1 Tax=Nonomuraea pusilla TaxID=46177 RepID=A0A1H8BY39_9ACTN|nr:S8 family serine peptidase [Nonomuraea pusilla]SEM87795.1 Serine protease, subtilisin family [Nonomuraea pusilla]